MEFCCDPHSGRISPCPLSTASKVNGLMGLEGCLVTTPHDTGTSRSERVQLWICVSRRKNRPKVDTPFDFSPKGTGFPWRVPRGKQTLTRVSSLLRLDLSLCSPNVSETLDRNRPRDLQPGHPKSWNWAQMHLPLRQPVVIGLFHTPASIGRSATVPSPKMGDAPLLISGLF